MKDFNIYQNEFFALYLNGDLDGALHKAEEIEGVYPDRLGKTLYWKACIHSSKGRTREAISALKKMRDHGFWVDSRSLEIDDDFDTIRETDEFKEITGTFSTMQKDAQMNSKPLTLEYLPEGIDRKLLPEIALLHWRTGNAKEFAEHWMSAVDKKLASILSIQSSQMAGPDMYCWDDFDLAMDESEKEFKAHVGNGETAIIAGASQGAYVALRLLAEGKVKAGKLILVVPALKETEILEAELEKAPFKWKTYIIGGQEDKFFSHAEKAFEMLKKSGMECDLRIYTDMGHTFPDDFPEVLEGMLKD